MVGIVPAGVGLYQTFPPFLAWSCRIPRNGTGWNADQARKGLRLEAITHKGLAAGSGDHEDDEMMDGTGKFKVWDACRGGLYIDQVSWLMNHENRVCVSVWKKNYVFVATRPPPLSPTLATWRWELRTKDV